MKAFRSIISYRAASGVMLLLLLLVVAFHIAFLAGVIPGNMVWGGKFKTRNDLLFFEMISLSVNILLALIILMHNGKIRTPFARKRLNMLLWIFAVIFLVNTIGNLFAETMEETLIFTPLTLVSAILCSRIALAEE